MLLLLLLPQKDSMPHLAQRLIAGDDLRNTLRYFAVTDRPVTCMARRS